MESALPPARARAGLSAVSLSEGIVRDCLLHPEGARRHIGPLEKGAKPGRVMVRASKLLPQAKSMSAKVLVRPVRAVEMQWIQGEPLVDGWIAVGRTGGAADELGTLQERLIFNLTASNDMSVGFRADIEALPYFARWRSILLELKKVVLWSWVNMTGSSPLSSMPIGWAPKFCSSTTFTPGELGLGHNFKSEACDLVLATSPASLNTGGMSGPAPNCPGGSTQY